MSWIITGAEKTPVDPLFNNVSLLLHGDGANGSTTIIDSSPSPKTVTAVGDAQISTAIADPFGNNTGVLAFDGSGDYLLSSNFDGIESAFTCELFCRPAQFTSFSALILFGTINTANSFAIATNSSGNALFRLGSAASYVSSSAISLDSWSHIAFSRDESNTCRLFVDGSLGASTVISNTLSAANLLIGGTFAYNGYIDDLRITKGVARYTSNFTPPTAPFPDF